MRATDSQRGAALLLMMLMVIVATAVFLVANLNRDDLRARRSLDTAQAMAEAKKALLDYAVMHARVNPGRPVSLPCPDIDNSGSFLAGESHTTACGAPGENILGRLPWRTLGIAPVKDAAAACLWYVVSGSFKDAGAATAAMINADTNGQLQLYDIDTGNIIAGLMPAERPVAMIIAGLQPLAGQVRPGNTGQLQCATSADASQYLETDIASGISNAALSGVPDAIDVLARASTENDNHNDRFVTISREEIERRLARQPGFEDRMRALGLALASCLANYAATNPAGTDDKRLPWPAPMAMTDYRLDSAYDDADLGLESGRLPDTVDDSNIATSNLTARVFSDCDPVAVPQWTPVMMATWQNWKDHFFYAVANANVPSAPTPTSCGNCLTVNGSNQYAAVLVFANTRLPALGQVRDAPPIDADSKSNPDNYLEAGNAVNIPGTGALTDYVSGPRTAAFNDLLFCIDDQLLVTEC